MTETMIVEAVRAAGGAQQQAAVAAPQAVADPSSVSRFQTAMGASRAEGADPVPFVSEVAASWRSAQADNQAMLHRIRALSEMKITNASGPELMELQYEIMNLSFQQEVVTKVADKSSSAIQTLVKNQ